VSETAEQRAQADAARRGQPGGQGPEGGAWDLIRRGGRIFIRQREATVFVVAVALVLYFGLSTSTFFSSSNATTLLSGVASPIIIISIGEVLLLICGEIDLSVGFIYTLSPFLMHYLVDDWSVPAVLAVLLSLLMGVVVGWINGFITVALRVPSFITTLGTGFVLLGLVLTTSHAEPATISPNLMGIGKYFGTQTGFAAWTMIIWAVILVAIFHTVLTSTRWGLHTVSVGGNLLGAREAGISIARVKYGNFMVTGFLGALVGIQIAFYNSTIDPSSGGYTPMFYAVAAAVLGGTALAGGSGTIIGGMLGGIVLAVLTNGFQIIGISANPLDIIFGGAILIAMIANMQLARVREAGRL
jgi:simple sugar transport system permease protein